MITADELTIIGKFNKPHGIKGEITASFAPFIDDIDMFSTLICCIDGIFVPFFIESSRDKGADILIKLDGVDSEYEAKKFNNHPIYALKSELDENDMVYCDHFADYSICDPDGKTIGKITGIDDSTENALFIVDMDGKEIYIPITEDFIISIDDNEKQITMDLPEGILHL